MCHKIGELAAVGMSLGGLLGRRVVGYCPQHGLDLKRCELRVFAKPESTEGVGRVSVLKRQEGAPLNLG